MRRDERGSATLVAIAMVGVLLFLAAGYATVAGIVEAHRRAQAAADLAALAGAAGLQRGDDPCATAARVARANTARLARCEQQGREVLVEVETTGPSALGRLFEPQGRARAGPWTPGP